MSQFATPARVVELAEQFHEELIAIRRDIHAHPEVARTETRTTALIADRLRRAGLEPRLLAEIGRASCRERVF